MKNSNINIIEKRRIYFILIIFLLLIIIIIINLYKLQLTNTKASVLELNKLSKKIVYGKSTPRGKIYDRNYNVIVDNVGINNIVYNKSTNVKVKDEIEIAYNLSEILDIEYNRLTETNLKEFWIANNKDKASKKLTEKEYNLYKKRKIKASELEKLKLQRITKKELDEYNEKDKRAAYIYYLMNKGYYYDEKIIKEEITNEEYEYIQKNKNNLNGIDVEISWKRIYPYGDTLRQILGNVSNSSNGIPKELSKEYLSKGYSLNDRIGISYLELQYNDYLTGTKDKYEIKNGVKKLIEKGHNGNDIVLSIDINLQLELEKIMEEEMLKAKKEVNTDYYDHSSVIITDPKDGSVLAVASKQIKKYNNEYKISDYTSSILTTSVTPGSIVKGASMLVGYSTGNLKIGDTFKDKCIKLYGVKEKCSLAKNLGTLNDITALKYSSNSYQFQLALKVAGLNYKYNMKTHIDDTALNTYRNIFKTLGLGTKSEIDLPNERVGYHGKKSDIGLLLNYAIGQYDNYSILELSSYINTIANSGERLKLNILKRAQTPTGDIIYNYDKHVLESSKISKEYFERVQLGFKSVMEGSLGRNYMGKIDTPAGKTGTSESFYDSDGDGKIDIETYTKTFIGYAPYDNPKISIVAISPNISYENNKSSYISNVNKRISSRICNKIFEIYK